MKDLTVRLSRRRWEAIRAPEPTSPEAWRWLEPEDVHAALPLLNKRLAQALRLSLEGLSGDEISRRLNIPIRLAAALLFRGRRQLRPILRDRLPPDVREQVREPRR
jgi:DNA-directed RNA polymerase specialized sigma24 family protein